MICGALWDSEDRYQSIVYRKIFGYGRSNIGSTPRMNVWFQSSARLNILARLPSSLLFFLISGLFLHDGH